MEPTWAPIEDFSLVALQHFSLAEFCLVPMNLVWLMRFGRNGAPQEKLRNQRRGYAMHIISDLDM